MNTPNLFSIVSGFTGTLWGFHWLAIYLFFKYLFLVLDAVLLVSILLLFRKGLSYRIKVDLHALPPTVADILKRAGIRERYADQWKKLREDASATPPTSYTSAIMGADALLDELLQEIGFVGNDVAERFGRLNNMGIRQNIVNGIFRAHKIRNQIAHTPNFSINSNDAEKVLDLYEAFLREIKLIV